MRSGCQSKKAGDAEVLTQNLYGIVCAENYFESMPRLRFPVPVPP